MDFDSLHRILKVYEEVLKAKTVARDILERRFMMEDIKTTDQEKIDEQKDENIKKAFLGLRMFGNNEVKEIEFGETKQRVCRCS